MSWIFAIQLFVQQILTVWLALVPARIRLGFVVQVIGSVAVLAVFTLQGIWLVPPWWAPFAFIVALGAAAVMGWRRTRPLSKFVPDGWGGWTIVMLFTTLGAGGRS